MVTCDYIFDEIEILVKQSKVQKIAKSRNARPILRYWVDLVVVVRGSVLTLESLNRLFVIERVDCDGI